jgi:hypothetical protein
VVGCGVGVTAAVGRPVVVTVRVGVGVLVVAVGVGVGVDVLAVDVGVGDFDSRVGDFGGLVGCGAGGALLPGLVCCALAVSAARRPVGLCGVGDLVALERSDGLREVVPLS